jgi:hypothetical protein
MGEFYKLVNDMKKVDKTLIIYDTYEEKKPDHLANLQSIAAGILSPSNIKIQGIVI